MKILRKAEPEKKTDPWEERSGLLSFLSRVSAEVERFNSITGFGLRCLVPPPRDVDGDTAIIGKIGFVIVRDNPILPEKTYCLYTVLDGNTLQARTGLFSNGRITTTRDLGELAEFRRGEAILYDWLKGLVKASCDK